MFRLISFLMLLCVATQSAYAWWNEEWAYRKVITIDTTANGLEIPEATGEFTALVRLHTGNFGYFFDIREGGADLRFMAADDATPLKHHVEKLDPINNMALFWVKIPQLAAGTTDKIYMYYGNQAATSTNDSGGSFDEATVLALHFDDASTPQDKSFNGNHPITSTAEINKASLIGQGAKFDGSNSINFGNSPTLNIDSNSGWTFSTWLKPDDQPTDAPVIEFSDGTNSLSLRQQGNTLVANVDSTEGQVQSNPTQPLLIGDWQHVALTLQGNQLSLYINGKNPIVTDVPSLSIAGNLTLGATQAEESPEETSEDTSAVEGFVGEMDEVRVAATARTAGWLAATADNQGKLARMLVYGGDESQETEGSAEAEGGHGGYFGIIIDNVFGNEEAIVEQIVIGFCGFMAIVSFLIMFYKSYTVFGAKGTSRQFLKAYDALGADKRNFAKLYKADKKYGKSPLFQVYKRGIDELRKRMSPAAGADFSGLEMKSISAIRSTLDATMVREGQKINSFIVLLTIAISGGPFIGLLGTVVGVMVTFAGIAASGEVNINAIAPGMAAALLATVAGLGVAIPSLFGYNYIGSHIKELQADMHVFAEEFMARLTESFGR